MRHNQQVVAPRNDSSKWPDGYVEVLRTAGAQEKTIPYYLDWVRSQKMASGVKSLVSYL
jgi:hypothetical protein